MIESKPIEAYRCPHPNVFSFEYQYHPKGAVAQDADGTSCVESLSLLERPSYSKAATGGVLHLVPEAIALEGHFLNKDLHPSDELLCHCKSPQQPESLNSVGENGEKVQSLYRVPVSHPKFFHAGLLFPQSHSFLHVPFAHVCNHDKPFHPNRLDVLVGEQDYIVGAKTFKNEHEEATSLSARPHGVAAKSVLAVINPFGFLVDVEHLFSVVLAGFLSHVSYKNDSVVDDKYFLHTNLSDDADNTDSCEDFFEAAAFEFMTEESIGVVPNVR